MIVAIDPGIKGAAAALCSRRGFVDVIDLPTRSAGKRREIDLPKFYAWLNSQGPTRIIIENVHSMPKQGVASTFRFGMAYGMIRAVAQMCIGDVELVTAQVWKAYFDLIGEGDNAGLDFARELFPDKFYILERQKDHNRADAMLIAWYAARPPIGRNW